MLFCSPMRQTHLIKDIKELEQLHAMPGSLSTSRCKIVIAIIAFRDSHITVAIQIIMPTINEENNQLIVIQVNK